MNRELRPALEETVCDVCGRTLLKGERSEPYLAPGGQRMLVCELCTDRAYAEGWIREAANNDLPAGGRRNEPRRSLLGRFRKRGAEPVPEPLEEPPPVFAEDGDLAPPDAEDLVEAAGDPAAERPVTRPKDPRHVRAVPTNAQVKGERAVEVFNESEHPRTIAGISRSLGEPWVNVTPLATPPSEVAVFVAWELSWYEYRVDLGAGEDPVTLVRKGEELEELEEWARDWNAAAADDGRLVLGVGSPG